MKILFTYGEVSLKVILLIFLASTFNGCDQEENNCTTEEVAFELQLNLSSVLNHKTTDSTSHIVVYYENFFQLGNLVRYQKYDFSNSVQFNAEICLPIKDNPTDSIILAILLIQNDTETNREPGIFLNVPYSSQEVNSINEAIDSTYLWGRPECSSMRTVFQNRGSFRDGPQSFDINVAGSFGIGISSFSDKTIEEIELIGNESLLDFYELGWCPYSRYYVKFNE